MLAQITKYTNPFRTVPTVPKFSGRDDNRPKDRDYLPTRTLTALQRFTTNPFDSFEARSNSCYVKPLGKDGDVRIFKPEENTHITRAEAERIFRDFRAWIKGGNGIPSHICAGAASAFNSGQVRMGVYSDLGDPDVSKGLARDLLTYARERSRLKGNPFSVFLAVFKNPPSFEDEKQFEELMWDTLSQVSEHEFKAGPYRPEDLKRFKEALAKAKRGENPDFNWEFMNNVFFVNGTNPNSALPQRNFTLPTFVMNLKEQFDWLKETGTFSKFETTMRRRVSQRGDDYNPNIINEDGLTPDDYTETSSYTGRVKTTDEKMGKALLFKLPELSDIERSPKKG